MHGVALANRAKEGGNEGVGGGKQGRMDIMFLSTSPGGEQAHTVTLMNTHHTAQESQSAPGPDTYELSEEKGQSHHV
ncbi:hypothetical protein NQZ68_035564 [Dissostichus eleginoides]|nr:hypothetical protein NQZ68_035564 [Dissostichus eleginoides]